MKHTFKTRVTASCNQHTTTAEFDFTGVTPEQLQQLCLAPLTIMVQATYRASTVIPATDTIVVSKLLTGERAPRKITPAAILTRAKTMTPEERTALIAEMQRLVDTESAV